MSCSLLIQCVYPLEGLNHFFWTYKFESETAGVGRILPAEQPGGGMWSTNGSLGPQITWLTCLFFFFSSRIADFNQAAHHCQEEVVHLPSPQLPSSLRQDPKLPKGLPQERSALVSV